MEKKNLLIIAATHGDEGFSIPVMERLGHLTMPRMSLGGIWPPAPPTIEWVNYPLTMVVGNPPALEKGVRFIDADLNRVFPGNPQSEKWEERRAAELMPIIQGHEVVIDIHGASCDVGVCAIITNPTPANLTLAAVLPVRNIVISAAKSSLPAGCRHLVQEAGSGLVLECGPKDSPLVAAELERVLRRCIDVVNARKVIVPTTPKNWFASYDYIEQEKVRGCKNFVETEIDGERFFPFLVFDNDPAYEVYKCSKLRKIDFWKLFEY